MKRIIGTDWATGLCPYNGLLKVLAYHGGSVMLDAALPYLRNSGRLLNELTGSEEIRNPFAARLDLLLRAHALPSDEKTAVRMLAIQPELLSDMSVGSQEGYTGVLTKIVPPLPLDVAVPVEEAEDVAVSNDYVAA